uniref:Uncharacterized protein n=1 Tax=Knipowitschia caucasica TaxID=637954 RepID=A0AAV2KM27_KNICA
MARLGRHGMAWHRTSPDTESKPGPGPGPQSSPSPHESTENTTKLNYRRRQITLCLRVVRGTTGDTIHRIEHREA